MDTDEKIEWINETILNLIRRVELIEEKVGLIFPEIAKIEHPNPEDKYVRQFNREAFDFRLGIQRWDSNPLLDSPKKK